MKAVNTSWRDILASSFWWNRSEKGSDFWADLYHDDPRWTGDAPQSCHILVEFGHPPFSRLLDISPEELLWHDAFVKLANYVSRFGNLPSEEVSDFIFKEVLAYPGGILLNSIEVEEKIS